MKVMKKVMFVALATMMLASCKKDWVCSCSPYDEDSTYLIKGKSKRDAKSYCEGTVKVGLMTVGGNNCTLSK